MAKLDIRAAQGSADIEAAQKLRYRVFYEEMSAKPSPEQAAAKRDFDAFDEICDHLLVIDEELPAEDAVVGTYRLLREEVADKAGGFYSAQEFDLAPIYRSGVSEKLHTYGQYLELGRSCVLAPYRTNAIIQILWKGIAAYTEAHNISFLFGCASIPGTDIEGMKEQLAFLHHHCRAPEEMIVSALPEHKVEMNLVPATELDPKAGLRAVAPLIKGYLRLGCWIGDGAVVDEQFDTTDVFIMLPIENVPDRYYEGLAAAGKDQFLAEAKARAGA